MSAPFGKDGGPVNSVSRNAFDLSFQNNLTFNFGGIYPCLVGEVVPGDSFKIDTTFGLRFMPTAFPLQTRMRADIHYFYVRKRAIWPDWQDHYSMKSYATSVKKQLVPPYISPLNARSKDMFATGSLGDYLGVPTTFVGSYARDSIRVIPYGSGILSHSTASGSPTPHLPSLFTFSNGVFHHSPPSYSIELVESYSKVLQSASKSDYRLVGTIYRLSGRYFDSLPFRLSHTAVSSDGVIPVIGAFSDYSSTPSDESYLSFLPSSGGTASIMSPTSADELFEYTVSPYADSRLVDVNIDGFIDVDDFSRNYYLFVGYAVKANSVDTKFSLSSVPYNVEFLGANEIPTVVDLIDYPEAILPWEIKPINADVFRAYEMIYNAFYRDERNNPFVVDGEVQYNKFLPTTDGGEDTNIYKLHYRNWEQDFLTTAVPTPQMGEAPLVGITARGEMSIQDPESGQIYKVMAKTADDADTIVGVDVTETLPHTVMRSLVNYASSGISINDFRNVNAFQRWLETNIRKGFKYKDQIKAHYDVDIRFDELNMPEFIGGASIDILPTTVTQTSQDSLENPLGSYAGQLYGSGSSQHPVTQYCDEHGYIIGLISVVPVPNYSQLMPKHFWKKDSLDYFTPEFGHIGLQPIFSREVCPNQLAQDPNANFETDVFGYQRAHYDYLQRVDEVHGQFRRTLRNFVMNRVFDDKPELGPSFTVIDPTHLNDVFTVQSVDGELIDKILGQIYFNISSKRPMPKFGIPRLE